MHIYAVCLPQSGVVGSTGNEINGFYFVNIKNAVVFQFFFDTAKKQSLIWKFFYTNTKEKKAREFVREYDKKNNTEYYDKIYGEN